MNAEFLEKLIHYRNTKNAQETMRIILNQKIQRQMQLIRQPYVPFLINKEVDFSQYMLHEARAAHHYWAQWRALLEGKVHFPGRKAHHPDPVNKLLDVGYHYLIQYLDKKFDYHAIPSEIGILHRAHSAKAQPLVYDLMEWLRPIIDHEVFVHFRKKKHSVEILDTYDIPKLINHIKKNFTDKKFFHTQRKTCLYLDYWVDLYLLSFRSAVREKRVPKFYFPPTWHDTRCTKKPLYV